MSTRYNSKHCLYCKAKLTQLRHWMGVKFCSSRCVHADRELLQAQGANRLMLAAKRAALKAEWDSHGPESWIDPGYHGTITHT